MLRELLIYFQDGTIGDELVVKPISSEVRRILAQRGYDQDQEEDLEAQGSSLMDDYLWPSFQNDDTSGSKVPKELHDDYAFLDEDDDDLEDEDVKVRKLGLWHQNGWRKGINCRFEIQIECLCGEILDEVGVLRPLERVMSMPICISCINAKIRIWIIKAIFVSASQWGVKYNFIEINRKPRWFWLTIEGS